MEESTKYLIHATIAAEGVVERSDVVGAVFGQTEGLLGDELDLRDLQQSSKVGRIDVEIESENGQSFGQVTVGSSLDRVETAILAASLETIERIGPCRAAVEVTSIEDVRAAKRRQVVDRAKELLADGFDESSLSSQEILEEVRDAEQVADVTAYEGYPAGPAVVDSDAVIVVEGRADVLQLLEHGIKNAVAVEGTNVPEAVAELTRRRTVTAFVDGDRGGELVLKELTQVGDVDYVAIAPGGRSVEDLDRDEALDALRSKVPAEMLADEPDLREAVAGPRTGSPTAESATPPVDGLEPTEKPGASDTTGGPDEPEPRDDEGAAEEPAVEPEAASAIGDENGGVDTDGESVDSDDGAGTDDDGNDEPGAGNDGNDETGAGNDETNDGNEAADSGEATHDRAEEADGDADGEDGAATGLSIREHVAEVIDDETGRVRLVDGEGTVQREVAASDAFDAVADADPVPHGVVVDGEVDQRLLDVAAQRGVARIVGRSTGSFVKKPVGPRVLTADDLRIEA